MIDKAIFLDIDGVLNSNTDFIPGAAKYDPVHSKLQKGERWKVISAGKLYLLNNIITETDAKIILSSTWRTKCDAKKMTKIFQRYGDIWKHDESVFIGKTVNLKRGRYGDPQAFRQREIDQYLTEHNVKKYIILDDNMNLKDDPDHLIRTDDEAGLTVLQHNKALIMLGRNKKYQKKFDRHNEILSSFF